ncbi:phospholipase D-like domain-containing protein [Saccharospirillum sp.]|uniref:phospholipase D-like domain-containing protein n=1 Tax=Saccharospirillum sp. TaxID=2033801 RepID=UPI00349FD28F
MPAKRLRFLATAGLCLSLSLPAIADDIKTYFNHPVDAPAIQADLEAEIIGIIDGATSSLDIAVYDLDLPGIAQTMVDAGDRGVTVRFITDEDNTGPENAQALGILSNGGVPWIDDTADGSAGSGIQHNKFIIADGQSVSGLTGATTTTLHHQ